MINSDELQQADGTPAPEFTKAVGRPSDNKKDERWFCTEREAHDNSCKHAGECESMEQY